MARWKLTESHYLNVPGTKWEFTRVNQMTGRTQRHSFDVPVYLNPDLEIDWNYHEGNDGYIIVCHEGKGEPKDIIFHGDPTPGMLPMDDEAKAISAKFDWTPTRGTDEQSQMDSYSNQLLVGLIDKMSEAQSRISEAPAAPGLEKLLEAMAAMMQQQTQILASIASGKPILSEFEKQGAALGEAPVVDEDQPLEETEPTPDEVAKATQAAASADQRSTDRATARALSRRI
jgi:hypothetical protein